jgi:signal transduction histidine kinase
LQLPLPRLPSAISGEIRTFSYLLHLPDLENFGLKLALNGLVRGFSQRSGIEVSLNIAEDLGRFKPGVELTLFRVAQEALNSVYRHSGSKIATVRLYRETGGVVLEISDNGVGLVPRTAKSAASLAVGISGMRERVQDMGGTFSIERADRRGCLVRVALSPH